MALATVEVVEKSRAWDGKIQSFSIVNSGHKDIAQFFENAYTHFESRINEIIDTHYIVKVSTSFVGEFEKTTLTIDGEEKIEKQRLYIATKTAIADFETDCYEFYTDFIVDIVLNRIDDMALRGSGFSLGEIIRLDVYVSKFAPIAGSTYIALPPVLRKKHAIINVQNDDNKCFQHAILSALYPVKKNAQRVEHYEKHIHKHNFNCVKYPVDVRDITKFEERNPTLSVNVYMFDEKDERIYSMRLTKHVKEKHIHLLLLTKKPSNHDDNNISHYCWIKNMSALIGKQCSSNTARKYFCDRCLNYFTNAEKMVEHTFNCMQQNECSIEMPTVDTKIVKFEQYSKQLKVPFVMYADP